MPRHDSRLHLLLAGLLVAPALHPLLIPVLGVPSHLLWWLHVLPVALTAFWHGRRRAVGVVLASLFLLVAGERAFGAGYGVAASWNTVWSLAMALFGTHLLVAGFALYARRTAHRYQLLFDNAAAAVLRTDEEGRITAGNPAALSLFGCRWEEIRGQAFQDISWLRHLPSPLELCGEGWSGTITVGCPGEESRIHVTVVASGGGEPPGYQILVFDRTDDVVRDRELERQGRLAALGATLSGVAHELKNPLQVISAFAELALEPDVPPAETREALETIHGQSRRMRDLVEELLGFSREGEGRDEVPLDELIGEVLRMQRVARGHTVHLKERIDWKGDVEVNGVKVEQILVNLVSNAIDAVPEGRGIVEVALHEEDGDAVVSVADNGPGIPPELAERIFDPFVSTKEAGEGTGLGLAICRRIASSMGARLTVADQPEGGAVFTLRIPTQSDPTHVGSAQAEVRA